MQRERLEASSRREAEALASETLSAAAAEAAETSRPETSAAETSRSETSLAAPPDADDAAATRLDVDAADADADADDDAPARPRDPAALEAEEALVSLFPEAPETMTKDAADAIKDALDAKAFACRRVDVFPKGAIFRGSVRGANGTGAAALAACTASVKAAGPRRRVVHQSCGRGGAAARTLRGPRRLYVPRGRSASRPRRRRDHARRDNRP